MKLWISGRVNHVGGPFSYWDLTAVCHERETALKFCERPGDFLAPIETDTRLPDDPLIMEGVEWPCGEPHEGLW